VLLERKRELPEKSYTANLFREGRDRILKKVVEETGEVIIAAKNPDKPELIRELADLVFHIQLLLVNEDISLSDIVHELERRHR